jgi:hypothetical protein
LVADRTIGFHFGELVNPMNSNPKKRALKALVEGAGTPRE